MYVRLDSQQVQQNSGLHELRSDIGQIQWSRSIREVSCIVHNVVLNDRSSGKKQIYRKNGDVFSVEIEVRCKYKTANQSQDSRCVW